MKWLNSALFFVLCLSFSASILRSEVNDSLQLPEEIKNLTNDQIFVPSTPIIPIYPLRAKKDGVNADVWVKYKIIQGKIDSVKVIFCSKDGYNLENAAIMSLKEYDFSKDSATVNSESEWLYSRVTFGYGIYNSLSETSRKTIAYQSEANIEFKYEGIVESMPELIYKVRPAYPLKAKYEGIEATVYVRVLVSKSGRPIDAKIENKVKLYDDYGFNDAVLRSVMLCKFKPAIQMGKPVNVWVTFPYEFSLNKK